MFCQIYQNKQNTTSFQNFLNFRIADKGLCTCTALAKPQTMLNLGRCVHVAELAREKDKMSDWSHWF